MMKSSITELQGMMGGEMGQSMQQLRQSAASGEGQMRATLDLAKEMGSGISRQQEARKIRGAALFQEYKKKMGMVQPEAAAATRRPRRHSRNGRRFRSSEPSTEWSTEVMESWSDALTNEPGVGVEACWSIGMLPITPALHHSITPIPLIRMTTRGKIVLTIVLLAVVGFGVYRWWDKIAPQSKPQNVSVDVAKVKEEIAKAKAAPVDIPLLAGTNVATLVERSGIPAVSGVSDYKKEMKDGKLVVEFPINVWPGWAPIIMANAGMDAERPERLCQEIRVLCAPGHRG